MAVKLVYWMMMQCMCCPPPSIIMTYFVLQWIGGMSGRAQGIVAVLLQVHLSRNVDDLSLVSVGRV